MHFESFLEHLGVSFKRHTHPTTYTAQQLAAVEHVSGYNVAKPVIVREPDGYAMCVLPAPTRLDLDRVAAALDDPQVELATEEEMADLFPDCELGAEPPVGAMFGMKTVVDEQLMDDDVLVMQAGTHTEAIEMRRADWERICNPIVAPITTDG